MDYKMNLKENCGVCLMILIILPLVLAATDTNTVDDVFKLDEEIDYKKPCFNNGTYCSSAAECNYTIFRPDNSLLIKNRTATNQIEFHNISFSVSDIGIHQADMTCCDGNRCGAETFYFDVTGSGFNDTFGFYILIIIFSVGIMVLGFWKQDAPLVILGSFGLYFLGIYILFNGITGIKDTTTTWATGIIVLAVAFYISAKSSYELIVD